MVIEHIIKTYGCTKANSKYDTITYEQNKSKLLKVNDVGYIFDTKITMSVVEDKVTMSEMVREDLHTLSTTQYANNNELLDRYRNVEFMIAKHTKLDNHIIAKILKSLFNERHIKNRQKTIPGILLNFNQRDYRIFVINNYRQLEKDIADARYHSGVQLAFKVDDVKESDFVIAARDIVYLDLNIKNPTALENNVYHDFNLSMGHSQEQKSLPERRFELWCKKAKGVEWFYKNGDKGQEYLSIVYYDKLNKQSLFYPDYLLKLHGKLFIVETKGGENKNHEDKNIDKDKVELKFKALKEYVKKHNEKNPENQIGFAFVRDRNIETDDGRSDYELLFSNTAWTDELDNSNWKPINDLF